MNDYDDDLGFDVLSSEKRPPGRIDDSDRKTGGIEECNEDEADDTNSMDAKLNQMKLELRT